MGGAVIREVIACGVYLSDRLQIFVAEFMARGYKVPLIPLVPVVDHHDLSCPSILGQGIGDRLHFLQQHLEFFGREIPDVGIVSETVAEITPTLGLARSGIPEAGGGRNESAVINCEILTQLIALPVDNAVLIVIKVTGGLVA